MNDRDERLQGAPQPCRDAVDPQLRIFIDRVIIPALLDRLWSPNMVERDGSTDAVCGQPVITRRWLTVRDAARHARCGVRVIYEAVRRGRLRAARLGGRRELRFLTEWIDQWLIG